MIALILRWLTANLWRTACIVLLLACGAEHWRAEHWKAEVAAIEAKAAKAEAQAAKARLALAEARATVNERVVTKYVDRVRVVHERGATIVKEVPIYVPADSPSLPPGFRVLHDAAAQGELPDPARIADAAPVPAQDAASTVAGNYTACLATAEQLTALQDWIRQQQALVK